MSILKKYCQQNQLIFVSDNLEEKKNIKTSLELDIYLMFFSKIYYLKASKSYSRLAAVVNMCFMDAQLSRSRYFQQRYPLAFLLDLSGMEMKTYALLELFFTSVVIFFLPSIQTNFLHSSLY